MHFISSKLLVELGFAGFCQITSRKAVGLRIKYEYVSGCRGASEKILILPKNSKN